MFSISEKVFPVIVAFLFAIVLCLGVYSRVLYTDNKVLNTTITTLSSEIAVKEVEKVGLKSSLKSQNIEIEKNKIDLDEKKKELEEWKNKPPDIKYKTIEKIIKQGDSNECENIKNMLDDIRNTSF